MSEMLLHDYTPQGADGILATVLRVAAAGSPADGVLPPCECGQDALADVHATPRSIAGNYLIAVKMALKLLEDPTPDHIAIARGALTGAMGAHENARRLWPGQG